MSDVTFDMKNNHMEVHHKKVEPWRVTLVDTGDTTMTGGRLKRVRDYIGDETFCFTYGDGVSDVDITQLIQFHQAEDALATVTAVQPPGRFGSLEMDNNRITRFKEKPGGDGGWINGGFFVLSPKVINYIENDKTTWENEPMEHLAEEGQLTAFKHSGFWQPMDTLRDKTQLEEFWGSCKAPWKKWQ